MTCSPLAGAADRTALQLAVAVSVGLLAVPAVIGRHQAVAAVGDGPIFPIFSVPVPYHRVRERVACRDGGNSKSEGCGQNRCKFLSHGRCPCG